MYADLCVQLHTFFVEHPLDTDPKGTAFKKILLNECQLSFERDLAPPKDMLETLSGEDRTIGEMAYKRRMLGTIKFVGNLLTRRMLASKVTIAVAEELLADPTCEALESLATLLTVVGPVFDAPEWPYHLALKAIFDRVSGLSKQSSVDTRARCLLKDVLDLRAAEWTDRKPKKVEGPKKLAEVAAEEGCQKSTSTKELRNIVVSGRLRDQKWQSKMNTDCILELDAQCQALSERVDSVEKVCQALETQNNELRQTCQMLVEQNRRLESLWSSVGSPAAVQASALASGRSPAVTQPQASAEVATFTLPQRTSLQATSQADGLSAATALQQACSDLGNPAVAPYDMFGIEMFNRALDTPSYQALLLRRCSEEGHNAELASLHHAAELGTSCARLEPQDAGLCLAESKLQHRPPGTVGAEPSLLDAASDLDLDAALSLEGSGDREARKAPDKQSVLALH
eukprot:gnl/TRDRNA2_/TRDRNA2_167601_c2_seq8.p1 gnl/TRDRNA2_/TRDRNA2_167601_c2~~gnl/TRDRNA2_/TRDRNA2_167601_c2_seq8.p1  ORF type:complete len:457 (+),score=86.32 gnl/TRDRNA2_/TRDRNA2_167601_c2_seq8:771-2141(+)